MTTNNTGDGATIIAFPGSRDPRETFRAYAREGIKAAREALAAAQARVKERANTELPPTGTGGRG